jgi:SRSO17 transposase
VSRHTLYAWQKKFTAEGPAGLMDRPKGAPPDSRVVEEQADGQLKYALSNLPPRTGRARAVRLWKSRWPVEQGYQQLKEELGLDHFEGRSWRGFHHHAAMTFLAYGFLLLEKLATPPAKPRRGKKGARR